MRKITFYLVIAFALPLFAENYLINGGQESQINYQMQQKVVPPPGTRKLILSFVTPESFTSPTFNQRITGFKLTFSQRPTTRENDVDQRGNKITRAIWKNPKGEIISSITLTALNSTRLQPLRTRAPFPPAPIARDVRPYLTATKQVPSKDSRIVAKAKQVTASAKTEFDAVQQILTWVVDHMHYVLTPQSYNAMYSFKTGKGNCQNYSHLAAALMRAVGIPARIVNGVTLKKSYDVKTGGGVFTLRMAQGRHSWIEVYFPDLGWVPFDPQQMEMYVSNRFIRVEVGLDNNETENDGLIRWTQSRGSSGKPKFEETIDASFVADRINLAAKKQVYGPRKLLFCPQIDATFAKKIVAPPPPPPKPVSRKKLKTLQYKKPYFFGNLEFPQNVDFLSTRGPAQMGKGGTMEMKKNFLVETAEYVTTRGNQYAQTFILKKPMRLGKVGLALHKFGGSGQIWIEILKDDGHGKPGKYVATSEMMTVNAIKFVPGYTWIDFSFAKEMPRLSPGRYWIALGFTGSPVINWFFTYGKPVGPEDGTRYKTMFDETWSRSLAYEFNYRVVGLAAE